MDLRSGMKVSVLSNQMLSIGVFAIWVGNSYPDYVTTLGKIDLLAPMKFTHIFAYNLPSLFLHYFIINPLVRKHVH